MQYAHDRPGEVLAAQMRAGERELRREMKREMGRRHERRSRDEHVPF